MKNFQYIFRKVNEITDTVIHSFEDNEHKEFDLHDGVIIGLLEEIIGKIKSLEILVTKENFNAIDTIMRSTFEAYVYLMFILEKDTEKRAKAYAFKSKLDELKLFELYTGNDSEGKSIRRFLNIPQEEILRLNSRITPEYINQYKEKYKNLYKPSEMKKKWYNFNGKTNNFEQLCKSIKKEEEYHLIYRFFSKDVHSSRALSRVRAKENEIQIGIFDANPSLHINLSTSFLLESGKAVLEYYNLKKALTLFKSNIRINYRK